jgi:D-alanyl-lipoteichoic acid acyltransferase DltB (MBOAT superfamily)
MLRLISFSIDYHWACNRIGIADVRSLSACSCPTGLSSHALRLQPGRAVDDKKRAAVFHSRETYTFRSYLAYVLYAPLYIAGPIITFNDFMWQVRTRYPIIHRPWGSCFCIQLTRPADIAPRATARYALRFLISLLTMETLIHVMHVVAIKDARAWSGMTPAQLSMLGFWNLIFVWLKVCRAIRSTSP